MLIDAGGIHASGYGADISRTFAVSGQPTEAQREVYDAVLDVQKTLITVRPPTPFRDARVHAKWVT